MALSLGITRDVQVSYSISDVKAAVEKVALVSKSKCQIEGRDDVMNTFKIALIGGLLVIVPISLQLKQISETETQIVLTSNKATNTGNQANDIADAFLSKKEFNFKEMQIKPSGNIEDFSDITEFSIDVGIFTKDVRITFEEYCE